MSKILRLPTNWLLVGVIAIGGLAALLGVASQAIWTDTDSVGGNNFATGSVSLATAPITAIWSPVTDAPPGTIATGQLTVTNDGTMDLRYAVTGANTDAALAAGINLRIGLEGPDAGTGCEFPYHLTDGSTIVLSDDSQLFDNTLDTAVLIGSTGQGQQAGDRGLVAGALETLCFSVVLPLGASTTLQTLTNVTTFTFDSEQTANN